MEFLINNPAIAWLLSGAIGALLISCFMLNWKESILVDKLIALEIAFVLIGPFSLIIAIIYLVWLADDDNDLSAL